MNNKILFAMMISFASMPLVAMEANKLIAHATRFYTRFNDKYHQFTFDVAGDLKDYVEGGRPPYIFLSTNVQGGRLTLSPNGHFTFILDEKSPSSTGSFKYIVRDSNNEQSNEAKVDVLTGAPSMW